MISIVNGVIKEFGATVFTTSNDFTFAKIDF
jgi:hypothetical protein